MKKINQFINGKAHESKSSRFGDIFNPAKGEKIGCFGLTEPNAGSDAGNTQTRAVANKNGFMINGIFMIL